MVTLTGRAPIFHGTIMDEKRQKWSGRLTTLHNQEVDFDIVFWQSQTSAQRFEATWELVQYYAQRKGIAPDELRLQRTVGNFLKARR